MGNHLLARHPRSLGIWWDHTIHQLGTLINASMGGKVLEDSFAGLKNEFTIVEPTNQQVAIVFESGLQRLLVIQNRTTIAQVRREILTAEVNFALAKLYLHNALPKSDEGSVCIWLEGKWCSWRSAATDQGDPATFELSELWIARIEPLSSGITHQHTSVECEVKCTACFFSGTSTQSLSINLSGTPLWRLRTTAKMAYSGQVSFATGSLGDC